MFRRGLFIVCYASILLLVGCAGGKTTFHYDQEMNIIGKTVEKSFFASENLDSHYEAIGRQTGALISLHSTNDYSTDNEKTLGGIVTMLLIDRLNGVRAPATMTDFWMNNLIPALSLVPQYWMAFGGSDFGKRTGSPNFAIEGDRNTLIFDSSLGTGEGSQAQFWLGDYQDLYQTTSGEGTSSYLDASRPYTYQPDNSRNETYTDSKRSNESGLF